MQIREIKRDLFSCKDECLAHCVSSDFKMGLGIAKRFKEEFGRVDELLKHGAAVGDIVPLRIDNRFIYYLVTKERYWGKPCYADLLKCLLKMKDHAIENKITKIAMPKIGCGLDKLDWDIVKSMIIECFEETKIEIVVYCL
jgi:O-acetyl-ADP-ribose deacetylase (regulator of RNase III)